MWHSYLDFFAFSFLYLGTLINAKPICILCVRRILQSLIHDKINYYVLPRNTILKFSTNAVLFLKKKISNTVLKKSWEEVCYVAIIIFNHLANYRANLPNVVTVAGNLMAIAKSSFQELLVYSQVIELKTKGFFFFLLSSLLLIKVHFCIYIYTKISFAHDNIQKKPKSVLVLD